MFYIVLIGIVNLLASFILVGNGILMLQDGGKNKVSNLLIATLFFVLAAVVVAIGIVCFVIIKQI